MRTLLNAIRPHLNVESSLGYVLARYASAVLFALEALALARLLGPDGYGQYALLPQIAVLLLFTTLGSNAGYVYAFYKSGDPNLDRQYLVGATTQFVIGGLICTAILAWARPFFAIGAVIYLVQMPYYITEPMLRVRNRFSLVALGRAISIFLTLVLIFGWALSPYALSLASAIAFMVIGNVAGYLTYYAILIRWNVLGIDVRQLAGDFWRRETWASYWVNVMRPGLPLNASTIILYIFTNVDRLFIEHYRTPAALSAYSLAWQLSQGVLLLLTSMNLVSGVRVGERMSGAPVGLMKELRRRFRMTAAVGVGAYLTVAVGAWVLSRTLYSDYQDLVVIVLLLSAGYIAMNVVGSVTGVLSFERRATELNLGYAAALLASIAGNIVAVKFGFWFGVPVALTSLSLITLNVWFAFYTRKLARQLDRCVPAAAVTV
jgi:O-antigen/teichoic acid export membrane protein